MNKIIKTTFSIDNTARHEVAVCCDPCHNHTYPVLDLYAMQYKGHKVSIVQDGEWFDVRLDDDWRTDKRGLCWNDVEEYVERMTR